MSEIAAGQYVCIRDEVLPRLLVAHQKRLNGRVGLVLNVFTRVGRTTQEARIQWMSMRGNKPVGQPDYWRVADLRLLKE